MIVDTSALIACLRGESGHEPYLQALKDNPAPGIGAPTVVEAGVVLLHRFGQPANGALRGFLLQIEAVVIPFAEQHWQVAVDARERFGKGRHPANLDFGDCLTYAVAKLAGEPLLALGDDFRHTDLELVL